MTKQKRGILFIVIVSFVVSVSVAFVDTRARGQTVPSSDSSARRICNPDPPDYPGCTKAQVRAIAENNTEDWVLHLRFGKTDNVLNAAGLTDAQIDNVKTETRQNLRAILNRDASRAVAMGKVASKRVWTTVWRGNTYTVDSFPYVVWVNTMFQGNDSDGYQACFDDVGNTTNGWAYLECDNSSVPDGWDQYWKGYYNWVNNPGAQGDTVCQREIFVGMTSGAVTGGIGGALTGPGAAVGTLAGTLAGIGGGLTACAANALADQWGWD
jgi:hypothetical protein